ncbi:unnamed protein product, partial [Coregonus sp. 'balchen']
MPGRGACSGAGVGRLPGYWVCVLVLCALVTGYTSACPALCTCSGTTVDCHGLGIKTMPGIYPATQRESQLRVQLNIDLHPGKELNGNNLTRITKSDFSGLKYLRVLQLMENQIGAIERGAFDDMKELERLKQHLVLSGWGEEEEGSRGRRGGEERRVGGEGEEGRREGEEGRRGGEERRVGGEGEEGRRGGGKERMFRRGGGGGKGKGRGEERRGEERRGEERRGEERRGEERRGEERRGEERAGQERGEVQFPLYCGGDLSENNIQSIPRKAFRGATDIKNLQLDKNHISCIEDGAFRALRSLEVLTLNNNNISSIPVSSFNHMPKLRTLQRPTIGLFTQCTAPSPLRGLNVAEIQKHEFTCSGHSESSGLQPCSLGGGSCPAMCTCSNNIVDCRGKGLTAIPANLPDTMAE